MIIWYEKNDVQMYTLLFWLSSVIKISILSRSFLNYFLLHLKLTVEELSC